MSDLIDKSWSDGSANTILQVFQDALRKRGASAPFVDYGGTVWSLGQMDQESTRLARGLLAQGVKPGQCVASILDAGVEQIILLLANAKIGAIHVGINTAYKGEFLRHQLADCGANIVFAEREYAERILKVESGLPGLKSLFIKGEIPSAPMDSQVRLLALAEAFSEEDEPLAHVPAPADVAVIIFTGGTTGPSKGCMISHSYFCALASQMAKLNELGPSDVMWTPLPAFHFNQLCNMWGAMMSGARFAVYSKFSVSNFWPEIERTGATVCNLLASMVTMLADAPDNDAMKRCYGQLRVVGGVPFPKPAQDVWRERFGAKNVLSSLFGLTECSPLTTYPIHLEMPPGSCGKENENFEVMLVDANDCQVACGQSGEIVARPRKPHVMFEGYWNRPSDTLAVWKNGWFHTGDIGRFDEDGFLYFVDRGKDYLRRRGENISSMEMEATFRGHPAVQEVSVHAVRAELPEDEVKVTAILKAGVELSEEALCRWSVENVPYFAVPRFIEFRTELPRNPVGRILKYQLRDEGVTATTWDREKSGLVLSKR